MPALCLSTGGSSPTNSIYPLIRRLPLIVRPLCDLTTTGMQQQTETVARGGRLWCVNADLTRCAAQADGVEQLIPLRQGGAEVEGFGGAHGVVPVVQPVVAELAEHFPEGEPTPRQEPRDCF